jgi:hypothetical protein
MKLVYQPSQFDVPEGDYLGKFQGTEERPGFGEKSRFGKGDEKRLEWKFEVLTPGDHRGKTLSWITGQVPTPKSNCLKMLKWLLGRMPNPAEEVDVSQFLGKAYEIAWEVNPESESGNCHIARLKPAALPPGPAAAPAAPPPRPGPPPRPQAPSAPPPERFYLADRGEQLWTRQEVQAWLEQTQKHPRDLEVVPEGGSEWKPATEYGFTDPLPF